MQALEERLAGIWLSGPNGPGCRLPSEARSGAAPPMDDARLCRPVSATRPFPEAINRDRG